MIPQFVPLIGSGFDQLGQQQLAWQGFNQRQDEENARRAAMAEQAANNWFQNLAQMQEAEARRRETADQLAMQTAQKASADRLAYAQSQQAAAEQRRQFDVSTEQGKYQFEQGLKLKQDELKRNKDTAADYAEHLQPILDDAGQLLDKAQQERDTAKEAFDKRYASIQSDLPNNVVFNKATQQYQPTVNHGVAFQLSPEDNAKLAKVNNELAALTAAADLAETKLKHAQANWSLQQKSVYDAGGVPIKSGKTWLIRVPSLGKTFGKMVAEAKKESEPQGFVPQTPQLPDWARPSTPGELAVGSALNAGVTSNSLAGGGVAPPAPVFVPPDALTPSPTTTQAAPASPPPTNEVGFVPQTQPWLRHQADLVRGWGRGANYVMSDMTPQDRAAGGRSLGGFFRAMYKGPDEWLPPVPIGRVRVVSPEGRTGTIPLDQLNAALATGFKQV